VDLVIDDKEELELMDTSVDTKGELKILIEFGEFTISGISRDS
jgi:hypothetical protein